MASRPFEHRRGWPLGHPLCSVDSLVFSFLSAYAQAARPLRAAAFRLAGGKAVPAATATVYPLSVPKATSVTQTLWQKTLSSIFTKKAISLPLLVGFAMIRRLIVF